MTKSADIDITNVIIKTLKVPILLGNATNLILMIFKPRKYDFSLD